jgi:hypothetical protein
MTTWSVVIALYVYRTLTAGKSEQILSQKFFVRVGFLARNGFRQTRYPFRYSSTMG